ncbi:hypothetical protein BV898_19362 [Hypsibius exemplaris]|uniref:Uncharacterized protein n=1 Tax=Hypsibius exemplaris TaxID=2072580 RepID=A0A9X6NIT5_HYPEX|nr:hypothetical protein BV898_19362 [Hypsibius exemplaris]
MPKISPFTTVVSPQTNSFHSLEHYVLPVPFFVLRLVGFLPPTLRFHRFRPILHVILVIHMVGGVVGLVRLIFDSVISIVYPDSNDFTVANGNLIVTAFFYLPYISEFVRLIAVLSLFLYARNILPSVLNDLSLLTDKVFEKEQKMVLLRQWRTLASVLSIGSFLVHGLWEASGWVNYVSSLATVAATPNTTEAPFRAPPYVWNTCEYFEMVLFVASQQVVVTSMVLSLVFAASVRGLNSKLRQLRKKKKVCVMALHYVEQLHEEERRCVCKLNELFSYVSAAWYLLDFATCMGHLAVGIAGDHPVLEQYIITYGSIFIYGTYATACFVPQVMVQEEGSAIELNVYRLTVSEPLSSKTTLQKHQMDEELWLQAIRRLQLSCDEQPIAQVGSGNLMTFNRAFIANTLAFSLSFGMVVYEIVNKSAKAFLAHLLGIFRYAGVLPLPAHGGHRASKPAAVLIRVVFIIHSIGGLTGLVRQTISSFSNVIYPAPDSSPNFIVHGFIELPYLSNYFRAVGVLALFISNTSTQLASVLSTANRLLSRVFERERKNHLLKKWRAITIGLSVAAVAAHSVWHTISWLNFRDQRNSASSEVPVCNNDTSLSSSLADTAPVQVPQTLWFTSAYFEFVLFVLSQQMLVTSIVLSLILAAAAQSVGDRIERLRTLKTNIHFSAELAEIEAQYVAVVGFQRQFGQLFSPVNSAWYLLDFMTCMGFISGIVVGARDAPWQYAMSYGSVAFFGAHATVGFLPLVKVSEKTHNEPILEMVRRLQLTFQVQPLMLQGCGLLVFDRAFLVNTLSLAFSFALIAYEIVDKAEKNRKGT